jgi:molybdopterin-guanine dinucleotide biosynthesis protein A
VIVLAGGESRRFGSTKALAMWRGRRLIDHVVDRLRPLGGPTLLVTVPAAPDTAWPVDRVVYDDPALPASPLRGIISGLRECTTDWAWVVACDAPLVEADLLAALRREARPGDVAVIPVWQGRRQPLVACWERAAADALAEILSTGERAPLRALERLGHRSFPAVRCREIDPDGRSFVSVNSPEDLLALDRLVPLGD